jgi:hypothetical protein
VDWNRRIEFKAKCRILNESVSFPAFAIGLDTQGYGAYHNDEKRFGIKSKGLYAVLSKNIGILSGFGIHGGANKSWEGDAGDDEISFFTGIDFALNGQLAVLVEYDVALNDNRKNNSFGKGDGYLNAGIRWAISEQFFMEFDMKDLLRNVESAEELNREVRVAYRSCF